MIHCKNCGTDVTSKFCPNCGQPAVLKRIDAHYITHEIEHVLHFERGILYTIRELITTPGKNIRHYISENRSRLVKPIIFIIVTSLIYSIITHFFHIEENYVRFYESTPSATASMYLWIQHHYGYANIIMGIFIAFWAKLFFKKYGYNIFEITILLCFTMGMTMLIYTVFALIEGITQKNSMIYGSILGFCYCIWSMGQFFDQRKITNYIKALAAYLIGFMTFTIAIFLIGTIIDTVFI